MNEIKTPRGTLLWRSPTILENARLLKAARKALSEGDILDAKASIIEMVGELLDFSKMEVKSFEELNKLGDEMTGPVMQIAENILDRLIEAFAKKP